MWTSVIAFITISQEKKKSFYQRCVHKFITSNGMSRLLCQNTSYPQCSSVIQATS